MYANTSTNMYTQQKPIIGDFSNKPLMYESWHTMQVRRYTIVVHKRYKQQKDAAAHQTSVHTTIVMIRLYNTGSLDNGWMPHHLVQQAAYADSAKWVSLIN